jgi:uncharacterized protein (DUF362 family)
MTCFSELNALEYFKNLKTAIWQGESIYPKEPPFHPAILYPEYIFKVKGSEPNPSYEGVRSCLRMLELDAGNFGKAEWNPLGDLIKPDQTVILKPNFVLSGHAKGGDLFSIITHPSVLRAVIDYVFKALRGDGKIIIADAPQMDCNFAAMLGRTSLASIQELYQSEFGFEIEIIDLRDFWLDSRPGETIACSERRFPLPGDPDGSVVINLGKVSAFYGVGNWKAFYGADYTRDETIARHHDDVHEYVISKTVLGADLVISVPKLKVHKKVGVTLNAKGLVGITTNKNCLVHYTLGSPQNGGDQFPAGALGFRDKMLVKFQRFLYDALLSRKSPVLDRVYQLISKCYKTLVEPAGWGMSPDKRILDAGNWYGNDSAWRMVGDLMRIVFFADKEGKIRDTPQRRIFSFIDGIIGGENDGPLMPDAVPSGIIIAGANPLATDIVATRLMGLDFGKLKWVKYLLNSGQYGFDSEYEIQVISSESRFSEMFRDKDRLSAFKPHPGWRNYLEI